MDIGYVPDMITNVSSFLERYRTDKSDFEYREGLSVLSNLSYRYEITVNHHWWASVRTRELIVEVGVCATKVMHEYMQQLPSEQPAYNPAEEEHTLIQQKIQEALDDIDRCIAAHPSEMLWLMTRLGCARLYKVLLGVMWITSVDDFGRTPPSDVQKYLNNAKRHGLSETDFDVLHKLYMRCRRVVQDAEIPLLLEVYKHNDSSNALILHALLCEFHRMCGLHPLLSGNDARLINEHIQYIAEMLWMPDMPHSSIHSVVKVSGAPGTKAFLDGVYIATSEQHNGSPVYRKQSLYKGRMYWIINDRGTSWYFGNTEIKQGKKGLDFAYACAFKTAVGYNSKPPDPTLVTCWQVNRPNDEDTEFVPSKTMKCVKVEPADFVWDVDACDVVLNTPTTSSLAKMIGVWKTVLDLHLRDLKQIGDDWLSPTALARHSSYEAAGKIQSCLKNMQAVLQRTSADMGLCNLCEDKAVTQLFMPCKHALCCADCASRWLKTNPTCPQCRGPVEYELNVRDYVTYHTDVFSTASVDSHMVVLSSLLRALLR